MRLSVFIPPAASKIDQVGNLLCGQHLTIAQQEMSMSIVGSVQYLYDVDCGVNCERLRDY